MNHRLPCFAGVEHRLQAYAGVGLNPIQILP